MSLAEHSEFGSVHGASAVPVAFRPRIGRSVPASIVRLVISAVVLGLSFGIVGIQPLLALALLLSIATLVFPRAPAAWMLAALLAVLCLGPVGVAPGWKFFLALAGVHLLHVIGMTLTWLPAGGPVQLRVIGRILRGFLLIQLPAQLVAYFVLNLLAGATAAAALTSPVFGLVAALGLAALVALALNRRA
jgi:hypothetical protein